MLIRVDYSDPKVRQWAYAMAVRGLIDAKWIR
jgi:hypothetical protein